MSAGDPGGIAPRDARDWLLWGIGGTAGLLGAGYLVLYLMWGAGPVLAELPGFNALSYVCFLLAAAIVAVLAFGRYQVLREPVGYWVGLGFASYSILVVFYLLTWPGLLPARLLAPHAESAAWLLMVAWSVLAGCLLAAVQSRSSQTREHGGPGGRGPGVLAPWLGTVTLLGVLAVAGDRWLPALVTPAGGWTAPAWAWQALLALAYAVGVVRSLRHYRATGDPLPGYVAFSQLVLVFGLGGMLLGGKRYDLWWYLARVLGVGGFLAMLSGLLAEYLTLLRREQAKTREVQAHAAALARTEAALRQANATLETRVRERTASARYRADELDAVFNAMTEAVLVCDPQGVPLRANRAFVAQVGFDPMALDRETQAQAMRLRYLDGRPVLPAELPTRRAERGETLRGERFLYTDASGTERLLRCAATPLALSSRGIGSVVVWADVTVEEQAQQEREVTIRFLQMVSAHTGTRDLIQGAMTFFQTQSGCAAVGIRLQDGDEYPYYDACGFSPEFRRLENSLCVRDADGHTLRDASGAPLLACMCGKVICGRVDLAQPCFTPHGSFWANDTTRLLATTTDTDRKTGTRHRCNGAGYESVALLPLRVGAQRLGLLQLNDPRPGRFTPATIALWERLADQLAVAIAKCRAEEERAWLATFPQLNPYPTMEVDMDGALYFANPATDQLLPGLRQHPQTHPWLADWAGVVAQLRTAGPHGLTRELAVGATWYLQTFFRVESIPRVRIYSLDITQRKQAEAAAQQREEWLRVTLTSIGDAVLTTDAVGRITFLNPVAETLTGWPQAEAAGQAAQAVFQIVNEQTQQAAEDLVARVLRERVVVTLANHTALRTRDGRLIPIEDSAAPITDSAGQLLGVVVVFHDVTEKRRALAALQQARAELERRVHDRTAELSRAVETLEHQAGRLRSLASELTLAEQRERRRLAQVLHDEHQQLLVAAKLRVTLLGRGTGPAIPDATREVIALLDEAIEHSRTLARDLSPPILRTGGLVPALTWLVGWMREKYQLTIDLQADATAVPATDDVLILLFQSVRELLFNVVKHAQVDTARLTVARQDGQVQFVVADAGVGFDPTQLRSEGGSGGGFGLFSIRERVTLFGGRLEIVSAPGQGSQCTLWAPLEAAPPTPQSIPASPPAPQAAPIPVRPRATRRIRVLLVDDHALVRQGFARLLSGEPDLEIIGEAADGKSAVDLAGLLHPDVITMDINMPVLDGIEATRQIRAVCPDVRVIGLSTFEDHEQAEAMQAAGATAYLTKSASAETLLAAIRGR